MTISVLSEQPKSQLKNDEERTHRAGCGMSRQLAPYRKFMTLRLHRLEHQRIFSKLLHRAVRARQSFGRPDYNAQSVVSRRRPGVRRMNSKVVKIRRATRKDAQRISELAQAVAIQFIVDEFSRKGRANYLQELGPEVIGKRLADKDFRFWVAEDGEALVGVAAMQDNWHLYHLFVAKGVQRGGLAGRLWQILRDEALGAGPPSSFKANVPRYAIAAFTRLGFKADGAMRDEKGVYFQPMTCPVKRLGDSAAQ
jgi:GNAT superfamily N-acetyltransferase